MNFLSNPAVVIPAAAAILASLLTVFISRWHSRSRPWVGISSIQRDDRFLVQLPDEVVGLLSSTMDIDSRNVPLKTLLRVSDSVTESIPVIKATIEHVDDYQKNAKNRQRKDLIALLENSIFWRQLNSLNRRSYLPLPQTIDENETKPLLESADFTESNTEEPTILIETNNKRLLLVAGSGMLSNKAISNTKALGHVIKNWIEPYFSQIVEIVKQEVQNDLHQYLELKDRLKDLIMTRRLLINARIVNLGGEPEHISPFGMLNLHSAGRKIDPIPIVIDSFKTYEPGMDEMDRMISLIEGLADKQGVKSARLSKRDSTTPEYVVVRPGDVIAIELITEHPVNDNAVVDALQKGMLSAELLLERKNKKIKKWIFTKPLIVGTMQNESDRTILLNAAKKNKKRLPFT